jgi:hydrogenase nickel incorporation protein HypB
MCEYCGCDAGDGVTATNLQTGRLVTLHHHSHEHARGDTAASQFHHGHHHHHHGSHEVELKTRVLAKNDALAAANRAWLAERGAVSLNLMSGPGSGKTTLLERTIRDLRGEIRPYVLEGDQATSNDAERVRKAGADVVQVNTGTGCHLDAHMVAHGLAELDPPTGSVVFIENVGNLVCPALFDLGERRRVAIVSTTEGEDKPLKYPHMFREADLVILNKIDLLPHLDFDLPRAMESVRLINPKCPVLLVSARTGEGLDAWYGWVRNEIAAVRAATPALL